MKYFIFILFFQLIIYSNCENQIKLLGVIFRHGDRAPDPGRESYPNNPHNNHDYYPIIRGELNNNGKNREFNLGLQLRKEYDKFLGEIYYPKEIVARSTEYRRTRMSVQLVLTGLYPPKKSQVWNSDFDWQPSSSSYIPSDYDNLLISEECPQYSKELSRVRELPEIKHEFDQFKPLLCNLTKLTGKLINSSHDMYDLYNSLSAEKSMGLKLPDWAEYMVPNGPLLNGILFHYNVSNYNEKLRRLFGGPVVKYFAEKINQVKKGLKTPKIHLLSGHETNIASVLNALKVFNPHVPQYSSAVIIELQYNDTNYFVKIRHYKGIPAIFEDLTIPGCNVTCPLENFMKLTKSSKPADSEMICKKTSSLYRTKKPEY